MWSNLFNTPAHLTSFLRLFSDSFHIQSNLVTLLQHPKVSQKHINAQILSQNQQISANTISKNNKDTKNLKEKTGKNDDAKLEKVNTQEVKNARNLESTVKVDSNINSEYIEKVDKTSSVDKENLVSRENSPASVEKSPVTPLSPKSSSISDRLKQPKLQQKLTENQQKIKENQQKLTETSQKLTENQQKPTENQQKIEAKSPEPHPRIKSPDNFEDTVDGRTKGVNFRLGKYKPTEPQVKPESEESLTSPVVNDRPSLKIGNSNQTLKQRLNSIVLKTLQENTGRDRQIMMHQNQDSWKAKLMHNTRVICSVRECQMIVDDIMNKRNKGVRGQQDYKTHQQELKSNNLNKSQQNQRTSEELEEIQWPFTEDKVVIGFDCEGINLGVKGQLTLLQIATMAGFSYIFDLITCPTMIDAGLKKLLESPDVIKIIHDCRNDSVNLFRQFEITLRSVFDTQAAHAVLCYQDTGKPVYKAKSVALNALCECYGAPSNPMKEQLKNIYRRDQKYWSRRPLSNDMILYASADVLSLVHDKLYYPMLKAIKPENRQLMMELCYEQVNV